MDHSVLKESDSIVDLERGETTSGDDRVNDIHVGCQHKNMVGRLRSGHIGFDGSVRDIDGLGSSKNVLHSREKLEILVGQVEGKAAGKMEMIMAKDKRKKTGSKKPPKPPRPPHGPSLDAADIKLVREISELSRLRRARIEQRKEMKKMRNDKVSSTNVNLIALVITMLFCFVIIFQEFALEVARVGVYKFPESAILAAGELTTLLLVNQWT